MVFAALTAVSSATVTAVANVLSTTSTSSIVQFTFSGDLGGLSTPVNLPPYLFFGLSPALVSSMTTNSADITTFSGNSVQTTSGLTLGLIEVRINGAPFYDRMGFSFSGNLNNATSFVSGSSVTVNLPIGSVTSSNFSGLPIYWGMPANYSDDNNARGTLVGAVAAVSESSSALFGAVAFVPFLRRKRSA